jgi:hypothetical protein
MGDQFDALLVSLASVLIRGVGTSDSYGVAPAAFTVVASNIPCRISSQALGRPKEFKAGMKAEWDFRQIFMRPWYDGDGNPLTHDHWLQVGTQNYDIWQIKPIVIDSTGIPHHLEVLVEEIHP